MVLKMDKEALRAKTHMLNPAMWVLDNEFINENQQPFEFDSHRFMLMPYADSSPDQVIMKSAQVGWSMAAILKATHAAYFTKLNVIYVLPTRNASAEFVVPKVNPLLQRNAVLANMVKSTDNKSLKQVGDRFIYFRGAHHEGEAISTSADIIIADEYDRSNQAVLMMMRSRLQASKYRWYWKFSNPSLPGFGVHELFQDSDQMHWMIKCSACSHEFFIDLEKDEFTKNHYLDRERVVYACGSCDRELTDNDRQGGRWLPKYPGRSRRGYWLNQLMIPWVSAQLILEQEKEMDIASFHNMVLGLPYQASEYLINREAILRGCNPGLALKTDVVIGCDSGKEKHWVMGNPEGIFSYGKTTEWDDVERLFNLYNATMVIDALPDFTIPERLAKKYPGRVFVHYYLHDSKSMEVSTRNEGVQFGRIDSDRTKLFDEAAAKISSGDIRFFQDPKDLDDLIYHFENVYRVVEEDTRGILKARWEHKENKPDHWAHATLYYLVGLSFMIRSHEVGGVSPNKPVKGKPAYHVRPDGSVPVKEALGMPLDRLVERSLAKNKKRRVQ